MSGVELMDVSGTPWGKRRVKINKHEMNNEIENTVDWYSGINELLKRYQP